MARSGPGRVDEDSSQPQGTFAENAKNVSGFLLRAAVKITLYSVATVAGGGGATFSQVFPVMAAKSGAAMGISSVIKHFIPFNLPKFDEKKMDIEGANYAPKRAWNTLVSSVIPIGIFACIVGVTGGGAIFASPAVLGLFALKAYGLNVLADCIVDGVKNSVSKSMQKFKEQTAPAR